MDMREHELLSVIAEHTGPDVASRVVDAIVATWGGEMQMIPNGTSVQRWERNQEIRRMVSLGVSSDAIAERLGLSVRHTRRLITALVTPVPIQ